jgi:Signal transduction histidine kinase
MPEGTEIIRGVMLTSVSTDSIVATMEILNRKALIVEIIMVICIFAIALVLAQILIRPFDRISKAISEVKDGYTNDPISVPDYLETEHIVDAFNSLLGRMKTLDDSRQEFVANVSHELKTPITSVKVLADSLRGQTDIPVEIYREFMEDIAEEIEREDKIINDLLALVKMGKSVAQINISMVNINELTEIILKRLRPIARKKNIEVTLISKREIMAEVDEVKMSLILTNLVENAIKYNREQGKVDVTLDADHQFFTVEVADTGIGIPEESLERIYERFYRVDKSHSKEIGGTGLGLAITRNAILLHRGAIKVESIYGEGSMFTVKIPLIRTLI